MVYRAKARGSEADDKPFSVGLVGEGRNLILRMNRLDVLVLINTVAPNLLIQGAGDKDGLKLWMKINTSRCRIFEFIYLLRPLLVNIPENDFLVEAARDYELRCQNIAANVTPALP